LALRLGSFQSFPGITYSSYGRVAGISNYWLGPRFKDSKYTHPPGRLRLVGMYVNSFNGIRFNSVKNKNYKRNSKYTDWEGIWSFELKRWVRRNSSLRYCKRTVSFLSSTAYVPSYCNTFSCFENREFITVRPAVSCQKLWRAPRKNPPKACVVQFPAAGYPINLSQQLLMRTTLYNLLTGKYSRTFTVRTELGMFISVCIDQCMYRSVSISIPPCMGRVREVPWQTEVRVCRPDPIDLQVVFGSPFYFFLPSPLECLKRVPLS